jgi:uncharacterized RmlC-like cupin family protein
MNHWLNKTFETKDRAGRPNGRIIRVWEEGEVVLGYGPKQVYITTLLPGATKGPHLHRKRDSLFCCIKGRVWIRFANGNDIQSGGEIGPVSVYVRAGTACKLINPALSESAYVVNVSSGRYDPADDEEVPDFA